MAIFCPLFSSSSGNCTYLHSGKTKLLVDIGVSCRAAETALQGIGVDHEEIGALLVTHEHSDHIKGISRFLKRHPIPVVASAGTLSFLLENDCIPAGITLIEADGEPIDLFDIRIQSFRTSHDSNESTGFSVLTGDGRKITIATDLGYISDGVYAQLQGSDILMLESNYDEGMLDAGSYPYYLKRRIRGKTGHLSNRECAMVLPEMIRQGTRHVVLSHLSKENNLPALAYQCALAQMQQEGMALDVDFTLSVAPRSEAGEQITI